MRALGRHVNDVANELAGSSNLFRLGSFKGLSEHEIAELGQLVARSDKDICRRDIAVDNPIFERCLQSPTNMSCDTKRVAPIEHSTRSDAADHFGQAFPFYMLHGHPAVISGFACCVECNQVFVPDG